MADPWWAAVIDRVAAVVERLNVKALLAGVGSAILSRAAVEAWPSSASLASWLDARVFPHAGLFALFAFWTLVWGVLFDLLSEWTARRVERNTRELERVADLERQAERRRVRVAAYGGCSATERAVLAVFVRRSARSVDRGAIIAEVSGVGTGTRPATNAELDAIQDAASAIHALRSRRFLEPLFVDRDREVMESSVFEELVAEPALIQLDHPKRPVIPPE